MENTKLKMKVLLTWERDEIHFVQALECEIGFQLFVVREGRGESAVGFQTAGGPAVATAEEHWKILGQSHLYQQHSNVD